MTTPPAAIQGDYVDLRFVKTRKVCQIVIELPIEAGGEFVRIFGTPNPVTGVPVGLARMDPAAKPERKGGKLAQRAGILCGEGAFWKFLEAMGYPVFDALVKDAMAGAHVRTICNVTSRRDLDHDETAGRKFLDLEASYKAWLVAA